MKSTKDRCWRTNVRRGSTRPALGSGNSLIFSLEEPHVDLQALPLTYPLLLWDGPGCVCIVSCNMMHISAGQLLPQSTESVRAWRTLEDRRV